MACVLDVSVQALESVNPGISNNLTTCETIKAPTAPGGRQPGGGQPGGSGGSNSGGAYINYSGPASNFPNPLQWASYSPLWNQNSRLMKCNDSDSEIALIKKSIEQVARESGVDVRVI